MASIEKCGIYLIILIGLFNSADTLVATCKKQSYCQFEQWCVKQKVELDFCEGTENCDEVLNAKHQCELVLPFDASGMCHTQRMYACNYYSPYIARNESKTTSNSLSCIYETITSCEAGDFQIESRCYHLSSNAEKYEDRSRLCANGYKMFNSKDSKIIRWATILAASDHKHKPIWIDGKEPYVALSTGYNLMDDLALGENYTISNHGEKLRTLCSKPAIAIPNEDRFEITDNGRVEYFVTNNLYQPEYDSSGKLSVKKYHEICQKLFPNTVAANPNDFPLINANTKIQTKILHVAGQHRKDVTIPVCNNYDNVENVKKRFTAIASNGSTLGIEDIVYAANYPGNKCADKLRSVLVIHKNKLKGVVDEPELARHPLVCIRGNSPVKPKEYECEEGWGMSVRPNGDRLCFKIFPAADEYLALAAGYDKHESYCTQIGAKMATQEYQSDLNSLLSTVGNAHFTTFIAGRSGCEDISKSPCEVNKYSWHTMDGNLVPLCDRPMSIWGGEDPNYVSWPSGTCSGREACILWVHRGSNYWVDSVCSCRGQPNQYDYQADRIACMKNAKKQE